MSEPLPSSIKITSAGEQKEIFMSFNKLNRCQFLVGDLEQIPLVLLSPQVRDAILCEMLASKDEVVKPEDIELSPTDAQALLNFVSEHLVDFILGAAEKVASLHKKSKGRTDKLSSSTPTKPGPTS